jgi:DNA-binding NarL/FixJ family response regulator
MNTSSVHFSPREKQVYDLMITGVRQRVIAQEVGISVRTTKFYYSSIFKKLGVHSSREVVAKHYMKLNAIKENRTPGIELLSKAERRVYDQAVTGVSRKEIASRLFRSESTVIFHLKNISKKLGGVSMLEMVISRYRENESHFNAM